MRLLLALFIAFDMTVAAIADETFPFEATIASKSANIRSGPATVHYVTNQLSQGDKVQVFRRDPGGWYAIRPPQSEFSLVRAKYMLLNTKNGTGKVTQDGTRAWVGTRIAAQSEPMWQVQLQREDVVKVIGKQQVEDANGALNTWYEIAPPSGEFRWIHESEFKNPELAAQESEVTDELEPTDVVREESQPQSTQQQIEPEEGKNTSGLAATIRPKPFEPTQIEVESTASRIEHQSPAQEIAATNLLTTKESRPANNGEIPGGWQIAGEERTTGEQRQFSSRGEEPRVFYQGKDSTDGLSQLRAGDPPVAKTASPAKLNSASEPPSDGPDDLQTSAASNNATSENQNQLDQIQGESFEDQYRQLELLLTKSILKPADRWQLEPLHRAVQEFAKGAIDPDQQIMVSALLRKIESFEKLQQLHQTVNSPPAKTDDLRKSSTSSRNVFQGDNIARQEEMIETLDLPIDRSVRPAAFAENQISQENQNQPSERATDQSTDKAEEVGASAEAGGAIGTGVSAEPDSIYDGTGWLNLLYTNNGNGRPGYVLQDENGNIIKTILPAPGVNLDRYLKQEVGVIGRRGYNRKYNLPHVTADRVIVLERHR